MTDEVHSPPIPVGPPPNVPVYSDPPVPVDPNEVAGTTEAAANQESTPNYSQLTKEQRGWVNIYIESLTAEDNGAVRKDKSKLTALRIIAILMDQGNKGGYKAFIEEKKSAISTMKTVGDDEYQKCLTGIREEVAGIIIEYQEVFSLIEKINKDPNQGPKALAVLGDLLAEQISAKDTLDGVVEQIRGLLSLAKGAKRSIRRLLPALKTALAKKLSLEGASYNSGNTQINFTGWRVRGKAAKALSGALNDKNIGDGYGGVKVAKIDGKTLELFVP